MPRSFLVKKKQAAYGAWRWKEPEQIEWKEDNITGKSIDQYTVLLSLSFYGNLTILIVN